MRVRVKQGRVILSKVCPSDVEGESVYWFGSYSIGNAFDPHFHQWNVSIVPMSEVHADTKVGMKGYMHTCVLVQVQC